MNRRISVNRAAEAFGIPSKPCYKRGVKSKLGSRETFFTFLVLFITLQLFFKISLNENKLLLVIMNLSHMF